MPEPKPGPNALRQIERAVVGIYKRDLGRGPEGIRASWFADDCGVAVTLAGFYTRGEENLVESGRFDAVEAGRNALQRTIAAELRAAVEEIAQRVIAGPRPGQRRSAARLHRLPVRSSHLSKIAQGGAPRETRRPRLGPAPR
jgi:uncharacterized protein YbcI